MAINRKRPKAGATDAFIAGAPDAAAHAAPVYEKGLPKGNKRQISLTIAPDLLRRVDETAARTGLGRAAVINSAIYNALERDIFRS